MKIMFNLSAPIKLSKYLLFTMFPSAEAGNRCNLNFKSTFCLPLLSVYDLNIVAFV